MNKNREPLGAQALEGCHGMALTIARLTSEGRVAQALAMTVNLARGLDDRRPLRPSVRTLPNVDGEEGAQTQIRFDEITGVVATVAGRSDQRGSRTYEASIRCHALGDAAPGDARALAFSLLAAADTADRIAAEMKQRANPGQPALA